MCRAHEMDVMGAFRLVVISLCVFLVACVTTVDRVPPKIERPSWINSPGIGVSASAGMHVRGKVAQEELAIFRAREEYAKRFGVTIEAEQVIGSTVANGRQTVVGAKVAREEVRQSGVRAVVRAKWRDPVSDEFWVWLVPGD